MRPFAVLIAICALSSTATAQTSECRSITDADTRLACYDRTTAAASSPALKPSLRAAPAPAPKATAPKAVAPKNVDSISAEDAAMNARLRNICRGC